MNSKFLSISLSASLLTGGISVGVPLFSQQAEASETTNAQFFRDIPANHWAYEAIQKLASSDLINGYNDRTFRPDNTLTEEQFAKIATRSLLSNPGEEYADQWSDNYYRVLGLQGVKLDGMEDISLRSGRISRGDVAVVLAKLINGKNMDLSSSVDYLYEKGYTTGRYNDRGSKLANYDPDGQLTRGQAAVFIGRILSVMEKEVVTIPDANLEALIRDTIKKPTGNLTKKDMWRINALSDKGKEVGKIEDLSGLQFARNLQSISLKNGHLIKDLEPLRNLYNLSYLELPNNMISNIEPIKNLYNLYALVLTNNHISTIQDVKNLSKLKFVYIGDNQINDFSLLKDMPLESLDIRDNPFDDYSLLRTFNSNFPKFYFSDIQLIPSLNHFSTDELLDMIIEANEKADDLVSELITDEMSPYEKVKKLHDYIVLNSAYDLSYYQ